MTRASVDQRPTQWWLDTLRRRRAAMSDHPAALREPVTFESPGQHKAALKFFNAAFRAEQSGLTQAHQLADEVETWDPDLAEVLRLYGKEEGWHQELLEDFLRHLGGGVQPMGRVTRLFFTLYARAQRMESIVLTNLMFETIGSTTYRMTLRNVQQPALKQMLTILTRDESFHVPLNVHFLRQILARLSPAETRRLNRLHHLVFLSLVALPLASRPKSKQFDGLSTKDLSRAYARNLARLFLDAEDVPLCPPRWLLRALGIDLQVLRKGPDYAAASIAAAEASADRQNEVVAL